MTIDRTVSTVATPRIDVNFTDPGTGKLTQNGYALLYGLILRTGGTVAEVIDMAAVRAVINGLSDDVLSILAAPLPAEAAPVPADAPHGRMEALEAEMGVLRSLINALQQGTTP